MLEPLEHTLEQAIDGLARLTSLLDEERAALGDQDPARLEAAVTNKIELLGTVEPELVQLEQQLAALGLSAPDRAAAERLAEQPETADIGDKWLRLHTLAADVEHQNLVNGRLAQQRERATRAALAILTGRDQEDTTYSAKGASQSKLSAYSLAKA